MKREKAKKVALSRDAGPVTSRARRRVAGAPILKDVAVEAAVFCFPTLREYLQRGVRLIT